MLSVALALAFSAAPVGLSSAPFAQLPTQGAAAQIQWTWPSPERFIATLEARLAPPRMATGPVWQAYGKDVGAAILKRLAAGEDARAALKEARAASKSMAAGNVIWSRQGVMYEPGAESSWMGVEPEQVVLDDARSVLIWVDKVVFVDAPAAPIPAGVSSLPQTNWAYASTLLGTEAPVYAATRGKNRGTNDRHDAAWTALEKSMASDPEAALTTLDKTDLTAFGDHDHRLGQIARFLRAQGRVDQALALYARFQPVGRCSMDTAPAETARSYADLCYGAGRIGCFLQLQVRIMGDRFNRVAWSSYGEKAASTESKALVEAGVDARRFLLGLLVQFDDPRAERPREEMNLWRLARSMHESGIDFVDDLERLASDPALDAVNRYRATQTLWLLERRAKQVAAGTASVRFSRLDLLPVAAQWIADVEAADKARAKPTLRLNAQ